MTARFVLDETSWAGATSVVPAVLSDAVRHLLERLDAARIRGEGVVKHRDYYYTDLGGDVQLCSMLFEQGCRVQLDHDLTQWLQLTLDRVEEFDEAGLMGFEAEFEGKVRFAPGVAWAHAACSQRHHMAVLPLPLGDVPLGPVPVIVAGVTREIAFVAEESHHVDFFRSVIALENADKMAFARLARSAFPALDWADNIWRGLRDFSRPYNEVRGELVRYLGGLSDHGATCFHHHAADPSVLTDTLSVHVGTATSDENGRTKRHKPSKLCRTRHHCGVDKVFWWHVKLRPNVDRIYFLHEPRSGNSDLPEHGRIVVGLFKDHCVLPK